MTRRNLSLFFILTMVLMTAVGIYMIRSVEEPRQPKPEPIPVPVEVAKITTRSFTHHIEALGTIQAIREAAVGVKVSGPVTLIPPEIELGVAVQQGELLAEIDPTPFRIKLSRYEALVARAQAEVRGREVEIARQEALIPLGRMKLRLARAEHRRAADLLERGLIARQEEERAEMSVRGIQEELERTESGLREAEVRHAVAKAELARARAEREQAQEDLADTQVRAPFAGVISEKQITLGEQVAPGTLLFRLADLTVVKLLIRISVDDIDFLRPGIKTDVSVSGFPGIFHGRVEHIGPRADTETRTFPVEVLIENQGSKKLLPGMFARAIIPVRIYPKAILIPRTSVLSRNGAPIVFIADLKRSTAYHRPVTIARTFGSRHLIHEGLQDGDLLIITGQRLLQDSAVIRVQGKLELKP